MHWFNGRDPSSQSVLGAAGFLLIDFLRHLFFKRKRVICLLISLLLVRVDQQVSISNKFHLPLNSAPLILNLETLPRAFK